MTREPAGARESILATVAAYETAERLCRTADLAATFAGRGVLEMDGRLYRGRSAIQNALDQLRRRPRVAGSPAWPLDVARRTRATDIDFISSVEARAHSRFDAVSPAGPDHTGHYEDRFVYDAASGSWLIAHRTIRIDSAVASSGSRTVAVRGAGRRARKVVQLPASRRPTMAGPSMSPILLAQRAR